MPRSDVAILNYALTLEYLEAAFYHEAVSHNRLHGRARSFAHKVARDEAAHVAALENALGAKAVRRPRFDFQGIPRHQQKFLETAFVLENTGVHAYLGQAGRIKTPSILAHRGDDRHDRGAPLRRRGRAAGQVDRARAAPSTPASR